MNSIKWRKIDDQWNDEYEMGRNVVSGNDLHALALLATGDPSPTGETRLDMEALHAIAEGIAPQPPTAAYYRKVLRDGDAAVAARWALAL